MPISQVIAQILADKRTYGMLIDTGLPVLHHSTLYNCRVLCLDGQVLLIRPKMHLANDGNYREMRYRRGQVEDFILPNDEIRLVTGQNSVPFGDAVIQRRDTSLGVELCEELFTPDSPHIALGLDGVEIFINASGSHHELRKLHQRVELILNATARSGGVYLYANQQGCDGDRLYYDGCALISVNGTMVAHGTQFSLNSVEVVSATVDLQDMRGARTGKSRGLHSSTAEASTSSSSFKRIFADIRLGLEDPFGIGKGSLPAFYHKPDEEIALGPACWLWDCSRRLRTQGYFIPLSGGIDSCATSVIVYSMCRLVHQACTNPAERGGPNIQVLEDVRRICGKAPDCTWIPTSPQDVAFSSKGTRNRARDLAEAIGFYYIDLNMDNVIDAITVLFTAARLRILLAYMFAQLTPWIDFKLPILQKFFDAVPIAAIEPITSTYIQADEADIGIAYDGLSIFGRLRKISKCGPYSMFSKLYYESRDDAKLFFFEYARNRHKMTTLTPSYHAESYSPDDNRFDLRPFLYPSCFPFQFGLIGNLIKRLSAYTQQSRKFDGPPPDPSSRTM
ncbi:carbon-nitrogen hydrolase [Tilletiaria anomala UBC 951]|uniref:Glutamine-dependent NAD(+) synthetase n=1 Tax=Tilletiaria anomala (strain ATCC 24038 / CBS 436.72 / UBC 951) TaxID=1037660 RepID=A0A066VN57_TILAU|nr:carbon-nitrogen hydrolase [Tilletiaria anomala UBC 951]KDN42871.1 carbon-nitrogen hydrolase [Tilletiaria anomala UBC 951]